MTHQHQRHLVIATLPGETAPRVIGPFDHVEQAYAEHFRLKVIGAGNLEVVEAQAPEQILPGQGPSHVYSDVPIEFSERFAFHHAREYAYALAELYPHLKYALLHQSDCRLPLIGCADGEVFYSAVGVQDREHCLRWCGGHYLQVGDWSIMKRSVDRLDPDALNEIRGLLCAARDRFQQPAAAAELATA